MSLSTTYLFVYLCIYYNQPTFQIGYICGAVKTLKQQRYKPDASLIQSLIYLSKIKSPVFTNELITGALCSILRRDTNHSFKSKNALLPVLAVNLLMKGYLDNKRWPEMFVKVSVTFQQMFKELKLAINFSHQRE